MKTDFIAAEIRENIGLITINNPQTLNAVSDKMLQEIALQAVEYDQNNNVKVIILKGLEKSFAAGLDIKELAANYSTAKSIIQEMQSDFLRLTQIKKPLIALVSGFALGIGCEIALACDIVLATETAQFGFPEVSIGLLPCFGGCFSLTQRIGKAKAMDMILSGRALVAEEAEKVGIISRIVDASSLEEEAIKLARRLIALPQDALLSAKSVISSCANEQNNTLENLISLAFLDSSDFKNSLLHFAVQKPLSSKKA